MDDSLVVRTHYGDEARWRALRDAIVAPVGEFRAHVRFVEDPAYADASVANLVGAAAVLEESFFFVADRRSIEDAEHSILVVDLLRHPARTFRVIPREAWGVENNLSLANMDFDEFAGAADDDGVFRGFKGHGRDPDV